MILISVCILIILFVFMSLYFKVANHYNIIDKPNHRSSHTSVTIRGGGVIFGFAAILFFFLYQFQLPYFLTGLLMISVISLIDDILTLDNKVRLSVHLVAVGLLFFQLGLFSLPWYMIFIAFIFVVGTINAYNFMDGINGITGSYSLVGIFTFYFINEYVTPFASRELLIIIALSLLVFNFFNFRTKAKCFAGDVGSVSIAFIILFFMLQLIIKTENFNYLLLLLVYGLDAVTTIIFRLIRKENIFDAHRSHFYQYLANEKKTPHLIVSVLYSLLQLFVNVLIIFFLPPSLLTICILTLISTIIFIAIRFAMEGSGKLLSH